MSETTDIQKRLSRVKKLHESIQPQYEKYQAQKQAILNSYKQKLEELYELRRKLISGQKQPKQSDLAPASSLPFTEPEKVEQLNIQSVLSTPKSQRGLIFRSYVYTVYPLFFYHKLTFRCSIFLEAGTSLMFTY